VGKEEKERSEFAGRGERKMPDEEFLAVRRERERESVGGRGKGFREPKKREKKGWSLGGGFLFSPTSVFVGSNPLGVEVKSGNIRLVTGCG